MAQVIIKDVLSQKKAKNSALMLLFFKLARPIPFKHLHHKYPAILALK